MEKLMEGDLDFRECCWVEALGQRPNVKIPQNLLLALGNISQQLALLEKI
jgi:hypothetical protein